MRQKELYENVASELGMSIEKVTFAIKEYERAIRWFMSNPYYAGEEILINNLCRIRIYKERVYKRILKFRNLSNDSLKAKYLEDFANKHIDPNFLKIFKEKIDNNENLF